MHEIGGAAPPISPGEHYSSSWRPLTAMAEVDDRARALTAETAVEHPVDELAPALASAARSNTRYYVGELAPAFTAAAEVSELAPALAAAAAVEHGSSGRSWTPVVAA